MYTHATQDMEFVFGIQTSNTNYPIDALKSMALSGKQVGQAAPHLNRLDFCIFVP
jgi:hypothetical protein